MHAETWTTSASALTVPRRRDDLIVEQIDGQATVGDPVTGAMHMLNETAFAVFQMCNGTSTTSQIADSLTAIYEISFDEAIDHVEELVARFADAELFAIEDGEG